MQTLCKILGVGLLILVFIGCDTIGQSTDVNMDKYGQEFEGTWKPNDIELLN